MNRQTHQQSGIVLISVLIIVALISISVALILKHQNTTTHDITVINYQANAVQYLFSLEDFAKTLLTDDKNKNADWYGEKNNDDDFLWWSKKQFYSFEHGAFEAQLFDLQAKLNLNDLFEFSKKSGQMTEKLMPDFFGCFNRLNLALESSITSDNIINYLNQKRFRTITHPSELEKITYITARDYQKIRDFLFVLPQSTPINVNTADVKILRCLHPELDSEVVAEEIKAARPYENINDFYAKLQGLMSLPLAKIKTELSTKFVDVKSSYFVLIGKITIEQLVLNTMTTLKRNSGKISVINRSYYLNN